MIFTRNPNWTETEKVVAENIEMLQAQKGNAGQVIKNTNGSFSFIFDDETFKSTEMTLEEMTNISKSNPRF